MSGSARGRSTQAEGTVAAADADTSTPVLYRSASDGWRVGNAVRLANPSAVYVTDARTGLPENVRPSDVLDVLGQLPAGTKDRTRFAAQLLSSAEALLPGLHGSSDDLPEPACVTTPDLASISPSPLLFTGTAIDALRCRHRHAREAAQVSTTDEDATVTTYVGDSVSYVLRSTPPSGIVPVALDGMLSDEAATRSLAARVSAALHATGQRQSVLCASDRSGYAEFTQTAVTLCQMHGGAPNIATHIASVLAVLQAFTHDVHGDQHALTQINLFAKSNAAFPYVASQVDVTLVDVHRIATYPLANYEIFGFLAFALSPEEKERCYLPTRKTAKPPACVGGAEVPQDCVDRLRERYFVFCEALESLRFEVQLQLFVFARVAASMHLLDVTFADDGSVQNLAAMRNAAKLLSVDFSNLQRHLKSREHCVAVAKYLYMSTLRYLISKLNSRLNEVGAVDGANGITTAVTLVSGFAPSPDHDPVPGRNLDPLPLHHLFRHAVFEDVAQRFFVSTEAELGQWQSQGFIVPSQVQALLDPFDNYKTIRLLKAKGGVFATLEAALSKVFPDTVAGQEDEQGQEEPTAGGEEAAGRQGGDSGHRGSEQAGEQEQGDGEEEEEAEMIPYFQPDRDAVIKMTYSAIPAGQEKPEDAPPKKAMPPTELPYRNDSLALMAFIFAGEFTLASDAPGTRLDMGQDYLLTIAPSGTMTIWKKDKSTWSGNVEADATSLHVATVYDCTLKVKPSGPKSKPIALDLRMLVRKSPDDVEAHNDLMNVLVRSLLLRNPKLPTTYTPAPLAQTPRAPADEREAAERALAEEEARAAAAQAAMSEEQRLRAAAHVKRADIVKGFQLLARHEGVTYDERRHVLSIKHSFGTRTYALPPLEALAAQSIGDVAGASEWLTSHAPAFDEVREFLREEADVETQEAMVLEEQAHYSMTLFGLFRDQSDALLTETLTREKTRFWFSFSFVNTASKNFNGGLVERQLELTLFPAVRSLRLHLHHHYIPVTSESIVDSYLRLLPGPQRIAYRRAGDSGSGGGDGKTRDKVRDRVYAEEVCIAGRVPHVVGSSLLLISPAGLLRLQQAIRTNLQSAVLEVQRFARHHHSSQIVERRVNSIAEALAKDDTERAAVIAMRQWQIDHAAQHRIRRLAVQEEEFATRRAIADGCWIQWVALQTHVQAALEDAMHDVIADRVRRRQEEAKRAQAKSQRTAVAALTQRIQDRVLQQGTGLDQLVRDKVANDAASRVRMERMRAAHEKMMRTKLAREEHKAVLEVQLAEKALRSDRVAKHRESKREQIRQELWHRQERERVVREQIESNRRLLEQHKQEEFIMDDISYEMRRRVESELTERQRAQRAQVRHEFEEDKARREAQLTQGAKRQWTAAVRREKAQQRSRSEAERQQHHDRVALLQAQERERRAAERAKEQEAEKQKTITRKLLKAHSMLYSPLLFEQSSRGATRLVDSAGRPAAPATPTSHSARRSRSAAAIPADVDGFVMTGGKSTRHRLLPEKVWDGIIRHHERALDAEGSRGASSSFHATTGSPRGAASPSRLRSASPRSVVSL
jgi:hypothetical protein